jgi:Rad3-related DNA helicase
VRRGLSIPEDQCYYESVPTTFDQRRCPVYFIPSYCGRNNRTGKEKVVSVDYNSTPDELLTVLATADRIIDIYRRHNLNGIVHTTSYKLAKLAVDNSRHRDLILYHRSGELAEQIVKLKSNPNRGLVLFSPSVITGYDFPDGQCRYQILLKVPHRQRSAKIMKERLKRDSWYVEGLVADDMVQAAPGRGMRHPGDWCVSYILDGSFLWWERRVRGAGLVPSYWTVMPASNITIPHLTGQEPFLQVAR